MIWRICSDIFFCVGLLVINSMLEGMAPLCSKLVILQTIKKVLCPVALCLPLMQVANSISGSDFMFESIVPTFLPCCQPRHSVSVVLNCTGSDYYAWLIGYLLFLHAKLSGLRVRL